MNDQPKKRLLRSRDDRILAGVAGGIANYLDVDPTLVRVGFVATALFGGLGIAAYLVLAVVTPNDGGSGSPAPGERPSAWLVVLAVLAVLIVLPGPFWGAFGWSGGGWWWGGSLWLVMLIGGAVWLYATLRDRNRPSGDDSTEPDDSTASTQRLDATASEPAPARDGWSRLLRGVAIAVLVLAAACAALCVAAAAAWATATGHGAIVAGVVIAIGVALVVAALIGESRWRWLIVPALVLALPAGAVAAGDVSFDGGIGERDYRPASAAELPADGYDLGVGQMTVDLRGLDWPRDRSVEVDTDMGVGQTVVSVPARVCVEADANASVGHVLVRGREGSGIDAEVTEGPPVGDAPRLVLDAEVDAGEIVVTDRPPEAFT
ncbi:MAG TPA: PspC domain-containing protein, partial [Solirubrobacterales bacterium]|nr:PspC domain-containing protein [Solirubrobacterales bacterium]